MALACGGDRFGQNRTRALIGEKLPAMEAGEGEKMRVTRVIEGTPLHESQGHTLAESQQSFPAESWLKRALTRASGVPGRCTLALLSVVVLSQLGGCGYPKTFSVTPEDGYERQIRGWKVELKIIDFRKHEIPDSLGRFDLEIIARMSSKGQITRLRVDSAFVYEDPGKGGTGNLLWSHSFTSSEFSEGFLRQTAHVGALLPLPERLKCRVAYSIRDESSSEVERITIDYAMTLQELGDNWFLD